MIQHTASYEVFDLKVGPVNPIARRVTEKYSFKHVTPTLGRFWKLEVLVLGILLISAVVDCGL